MTSPSHVFCVLDASATLDKFVVVDDAANDELFMRAALDIAIVAAQHDDVPVGCVLVENDVVIGVGENRRELDQDPTAHAEIVALRDAAFSRPSWRMDEVTAYVTLEPCVMCAGALLNARVRRVVIGALDEKAGAVGSRYNVLSDPRLLHEATLTYGVMADESAELLRAFFVERRGDSSAGKELCRRHQPVTVAQRPRRNFATVLDDIESTLRDQRVVVVGGGIFGTMHALFALARGASVVHLERDLAPSGATVRNFGLVWVSGRAVGRELTLALRARELWQEVALGVPEVGFRANGSITLITNDAELEVAMRAMARGDAAARQFELLSRDEVIERNPALQGEFNSGIYCGRDAAVESRAALGALRTYMEDSGRYEYLPGHELVGVTDNAAIDHRGVHYGGDHVALCLGATLSGFGAELFDDSPLRKVRLYMAETEPFAHALTTSVANGDSFRYYPGFAAIARDVLDDQPSPAAQYAIQLLCQQRLHGGLTIGDTHEPETPGLFETLDRPMNIIHASARLLIGPAMPRIERRWSGVYHQLVDPTPNEIYFRKQVARGVVAVTGAGGRGMTLAPAIAEESFQ